MEGKKVNIKLKHPFEFHGETISELSIRRPLVADQLNVAKIEGEHAQEQALLANLAEVEPAMMGELDIADIMQIRATFEKMITPANNAGNGAIQLQHPVGELNEISLRRPKGKDYLALEGLDLSDAEKEIQMMSILSGWHYNNMIRMSMSDFQSLQSRYRRFLE